MSNKKNSFFILLPKDQDSICINSFIENLISSFEKCAIISDYDRGKEKIIHNNWDNIKDDSHISSLIKNPQVLLFFISCDCSNAIKRLYSEEAKYYNIFIISTKNNKSFASHIYNDFLSTTYKKLKKDNRNRVLINLKENINNKFGKVPGRTSIIFNSTNGELDVKYEHLEKEYFTKFLFTSLIGNTIYISYGRNKKTISIVKNLKKNIQKFIPAVQVESDLYSIYYNESIRDFMDELSEQRLVIFIINRKFLESVYCMYEIIHYMKNNKKKKKHYPIIMKSAGMIYETLKFTSIHDFWESKKVQLQDLLSKKKHKNSRTLKKEIKEVDLIIDSLEEVRGFINPNLASQQTLEKENYAGLLWDVYNDIYISEYIQIYSSKEELAERVR